MAYIPRQSVLGAGESLGSLLSTIAQIVRQRRAEGEFQDLLGQASTTTRTPSVTLDIMGRPATMTGVPETVSQPTDYQWLIQNTAGRTDLLPFLAQYLQMQGAIAPRQQFIQGGEGQIGVGTTPPFGGQPTYREVQPARIPALTPNQIESIRQRQEGLDIQRERLRNQQEAARLKASEISSGDKSRAATSAREAATLKEEITNLANQIDSIQKRFAISPSTREPIDPDSPEGKQVVLNITREIEAKRNRLLQLEGGGAEQPAPISPRGGTDLKDRSNDELFRILMGR